MALDLARFSNEPGCRTAMARMPRVADAVASPARAEEIGERKKLELGLLIGTLLFWMEPAGTVIRSDGRD